MFNLIIGHDAAEDLGSDRMLGYTEEDVKAFIAPDGAIDITKLQSLPTLVMPEPQDTAAAQIAQVGRVEGVTRIGRNWRYQFVPNGSVPPIPTSRIETAARELRIEKWELTRTHWAVKQADLYRVLYESGLSAQIAPRVFRLPIEVQPDPQLVAVMMPFDPRFAGVYATLQDAATDVGMTCTRADDIWLHEHIMDDIIDLIWRARVIIADLSGKNPNVLYEAGISHTLGRDVIQIAQSIDDIPFDLRSIRSVQYLNNDQGRTDLKSEVVKRLGTILQKDR